ncbi:zinc transporter ZIP10 [Tachyglossus aculeatus]|uniref:zinc transporter ZIP10 n=1 Tax=Tachyglossus aculeatus TaxID=9261 RepID=UPI0018F5E1FC|nr:zinc transporter ZIP10 [Tachyglossus aculeatus]
MAGAGPEGEAPRRRARKREAPDKEVGPKDADDGATFPAPGHKERGDHRHEDCLNGSQLLRNFGVSSSGPISPDLFAYLCPALLYQIDSRLCARPHAHPPGGQLRADRDPGTEPAEKVGASAWICGLISITVISLLSLLGVLLIPIIKQGCFKFLLTFLVALAVGTMSGDALLHLLPHSQGEHSHDHGHGHGHDDGHEAEGESFLEVYDAVLKGLVALGGVYLLFIIEHCIRMFKHYKQQRGKQKWFAKQKAEKSNSGRNSSDDKLGNRAQADWLQLRPLAGAEESALSEDRLNDTELTELEGRQGSPPKSCLLEEEERAPRRGEEEEEEEEAAAAPHKEDAPREAPPAGAAPPGPPRPRLQSHHSHGHCHSATHLKANGIASLAWMVIMGDGLHNFSDGLAIGAAFSASLTGGISTSIAVFCHELPHELGDFAVLLKAGMTVRQAIVYNLLSALMAYVGMVIGTAVGQYANDITLWIFAVTAGMFLYVALVDMLPEMLHGDGDGEEPARCPLGQFGLQNLGLLLGFAIMLLIALFEDRIVLDVQF